MCPVRTVPPAGVTARPEGTDDLVRDGYEILDFASGRVDHVDGWLADDAGHLGVLELQVEHAEVADVPPRATGVIGYGWRAWVALTVMVVLSAATGSAMSHDSPADPQAQVIAGQAGVTGTVERLRADVGTVPLVVSLYATGTGDLEAITVRPVGWETASPSEPVTVTPGRWRTIASTIWLDCRQPEPPPATRVEVHVRTDAGDSTAIVPLPRPVRDLAQRWREFCPASIRPTQPGGDNVPI